MFKRPLKCQQSHFKITVLTNIAHLIIATLTLTKTPVKKHYKNLVDYMKKEFTSNL